MDVARGRLAERGRDQRRRRHLRFRQHSAIGEKGADSLAESGVGDRDHHAGLRSDLLRAQRCMEIAQVILVQEGQPLGLLKTSF